jgi:hypothetical protein
MRRLGRAKFTKFQLFLRTLLRFSIVLLLTGSPPRPASADVQSTALTGQGKFVISGRILERGTRKPLVGVSVFILPHRLKALTQEGGLFRFEAVPEGEFKFVVNAANYQRLESQDRANLESSTDDKTLFLERQSYAVYETIVTTKVKKRDDSVKSLKREEFLLAPGTGGDPVKAVQNLPGVNRPRAMGSNVVIQGGAPSDTKYFLDGQEVPLIFHFGGLTSVVIPEAVERVDLFSAGYGPEFGRANAGLVGITTRRAETDRLHGLAFVDLFNAGALLEGPIAKESRFLISARQSYFGLVLGAVLKDNKNLNLTVAPSYRDLTAIYETQLTHRDEFKFTFFGSQDSLEFLFPSAPGTDASLRGGFENSTAFFRLIPQLTHRHSARTVSRWTFGLGKNWIRFAFGDNFLSINALDFTFRSEVEWKLFQGLWTTVLGVDNKYTTGGVQLRLPTTYSAGGVSNPFSSQTTKGADVVARSSNIGLFWRNEVKFSQDSAFSILPNFRVDRFRITNEWLFQPRPALRFRVDDSFLLRTAGGIYYQPPEFQEADSTFGNPDVKAPRAYHWTLGFDKDFRRGSSNGFQVSMDGFYKQLDRLVIRSTGTVNRDGVDVPELYNNQGEGRVYGGQAQVKFNWDIWSAALSYTLARSFRWSPTQAEYPASYDQIHNLNLVAAVELPWNFRFSVRSRFISGNPTTPIISATFDADSDAYVPKRGELYSERLKPFFQLDARLDKKWVFDRWILSAYLDVQNVTNSVNQEQLVYSYDFSKTDAISGLPILPTLGLRGEF